MVVSFQRDAMVSSTIHHFRTTCTNRSSNNKFLNQHCCTLYVPCFLFRHLFLHAQELRPELLCSITLYTVSIIFLHASFTSSIASGIVFIFSFKNFFSCFLYSFSSCSSYLLIVFYILQLVLQIFNILFLLY